MYGFGFVFLASSFVIIFKKELDNSEKEINLIKSYLNIKRLLSLKSIQKVALIFLTVKVS